MFHKLASLLICAVLTAPIAFADEDKATKDEAEEKAIDYSKMSTSKLRKASEQAAEDFYDMFNALNTEDDFDVHCDYVRPTGSRMKTHVCEAKFLQKARTEHATRNWEDRLSVSGNNVETEIEIKSGQFQEKLSAVVSESPELQQKLAHYNMLLGMVAERGQRKK